MFLKLTQLTKNACIISAALLSNAALAVSATTPGAQVFSNSPLVIPTGASEPAIAIGADGTVAISALQWFPAGFPFGTALWTGPRGATPAFRGAIDSDFQQPGK